MLEREISRVLNESLIDLDHIEGRPLPPHDASGAAAGREADRADGFHIPDAADEPAVGFLHRFADGFASGLGDVAFYERAGVEVQPQLSMSRSARTIAEARRETLTSRGARLGRARPADTKRRSVTNWRSCSSSSLGAGGTMSTSG